MSIKYLLFVVICLGIARDIYAVDSTLKSGETSNAVIEATIRKIRTKCILAEDYYFLRRLAETQMKSIASPTGGIWRVNDTQLTTVQSACNSTLKTNCSEVQTEFNVLVSTLTMSDLQKPLYSGLVMSLFILNLQTPIPVSKEQQAGYWVQYINPDGLNQEFVDSANELEQKNECASAQIDLVFVIDSSGSVGLRNFEKTKSFLNNIVNNLDISQYETRVAVVRYASSSQVMFYLGAHSTKTAVINAIKVIRYFGGGTATYLALDMARTSVFTDTRNSSVAAKVLVLVTDGKSNNQNKTIAAAEKLKDDGVVIFTIGVVDPNEIELNAAASEPSCIHFINLKDYNEIGFIVKEIESGSCKAPIEVPEEAQLYNNTIPQTNETKQQVVKVTNTTKSTLGTTVLVSVQCGVVTVYASFNNSYPNEADYDYRTRATDNQPGTLFLEQASELSKLVLNVLSQKRFDLKSPACENPSYDISVNPTAPRIEAACVVKHVNSPCTAKQLDTACYDTKPVVSEHSELFNHSIHKNGEIEEQVLEIRNSTDSSGSTILVNAQCAEVTVYGAFNKGHLIEDDHDYKTSATDGSPGEITVEKNLQIDNLTLILLSKKRKGLNSPTCDHPSYRVTIKPKDPALEVVCHRKQDERHCTPVETESKCSTIPTVVRDDTQLLTVAIPKTNETKQQVLEITNAAKYTLASTFLVSVQCGVVIVYASFNNNYPNKADYNYKILGTDNQPGKLYLVKESELDKLFLTVHSQKRFDLNSSACDNPSYNITIKPTVLRFSSSTTTGDAVTKQLSINAWICTGLLLGWQMLMTNGWIGNSLQL